MGDRLAPSWLAVYVVSSDRSQIDIGAHVFHVAKDALVRDGLLARHLVSPADCVEPGAAQWGELALVHSAEYLEKAGTGRFRPSELALLELPWSPQVADGFRLMAGRTVMAARLAAAEGARLSRGPGSRGRRSGGRLRPADRGHRSHPHRHDRGSPPAQRLTRRRRPHP
jgi:acetoin utilization deacetylase AcuC-like enzyme